MDGNESWVVAGLIVNRGVGVKYNWRPAHNAWFYLVKSDSRAVMHEPRSGSTTTPNWNLKIMNLKTIPYTRLCSLTICLGNLTTANCFENSLKGASRLRTERISLPPFGAHTIRILWILFLKRRTWMDIWYV